MEIIGMKIPEMFGQSGILALLGMGVVFGFLFIMVIAVLIMGKLMSAKRTVADAKPQAAVSVGNDAAIAAAITASVIEYRKNENR